MKKKEGSKLIKIKKKKKGAKMYVHSSNLFLILLIYRCERASKREREQKESYRHETLTWFN